MLVKDAGDGLAVFLARRSSTSRFMPGAYVFPGGAVEPSDGDSRALAGSGAAPHAVVVAAIRELFEEAAILFARDAAGAPVTIDADTVAALRARLLAREPFGTLLAERGWALDATALVHYSNWVTPPRQRIRFDTHFFVARSPERQVAAADAAELHDGIWLSPRDALLRAERNELDIMFPTLKHLERLARFDAVEPLLAHARGRHVAPVRPYEDADGTIGLEAGSEAW